MTILTGSGGLASLTFFNSQIGVAITVGLVFAIVCFIALFVHTKIKFLSINDNQSGIKQQNDVAIFSKHDLEKMAGGHLEGKIARQKIIHEEVDIVIEIADDDVVDYNEDWKEVDYEYDKIQGLEVKQIKEIELK